MRRRAGKPPVEAGVGLLLRVDGRADKRTLLGTATPKRFAEISSGSSFSSSAGTRTGRARVRVGSVRARNNEMVHGQPISRRGLMTGTIHFHLG